MSIFEHAVITSEGAGLIRDAVSQSKQIIITRAKCGSHYDMDGLGDLVSKPISWFDGTNGNVTGSNQTDFGARVVISFEAVEGKDDPVKSVGICAQIKKDGDSPTYSESDDVLLALACDDNSNITNKKAFSVSFDLPINQYSSSNTVIAGSGNANGDYVMNSGDQTIDGDLTIDSAIIGDLSITETGLTIDESAFPFSTMPLKCEYDAENKTVDLTLGDGTVVRLTVSDVSVNPE